MTESVEPSNQASDEARSADRASINEPRRISPGGRLSAKMSTLARQDTAPELALRSALHAMGLRYRVQVHVPGNRRRRMDIAFTKVKVAVFVDGCFWHGCLAHGTRPTTNREWWDWKIEGNKARDEDTNRLLAEHGWEVIRVWEHESAVDAAVRVRQVVEARRRPS
ncbi:very short patch repair endonuclease [Aeromicrobium endophyticum]|uniref:Very short patch repair endonuclease n=1 Tax=Aeromicrobium endophyticum TaxID=2292704 RepID=A0A371P2W1_9ACTN|nr:very short patch repair endonuclease [Aeromicrobium endophyticum]REK69880.1 very short patch repair endonuclease [Aeromicrobium endophyticum]